MLCNVSLNRGFQTVTRIWTEDMGELKGERREAKIQHEVSLRQKSHSVISVKSDIFRFGVT